MRKSRLSQGKQSRLLEHFVAGTTTRCAADLINVNRKTAAYYYSRLREIIADRMELNSSTFFSNEPTVEDSYFGCHQRIKRGKFKTEKILISFILQEDNNLHSKIIADVTPQLLDYIAKLEGNLNCIGKNSNWCEYNVLDVSKLHHFRVSPPSVEPNKKIEDFWRKSKYRLGRFNGIPRNHFEKFFKECEWRFNTSRPKYQLIQLKQWLKEESC